MQVSVEGGFTKDITINKRPENDCVRVGDVIGELQRSLRQPVSPAEHTRWLADDRDAMTTQWLFDRRVDTVNGAGTTRARDQVRLLEIANKERAAGIRRVDLLRGHTKFLGLSVDGMTNSWKAHISVPARYEYV